MKKIALVTCYFQHNYGSQLQALATQMVCDQQGWPCETIRIDGLLPEINRAKYRYFLSRITDPATIRDKMATVRKVIASKTNRTYAADLRRRDHLFTLFASTQFFLSRRYGSKAELGAAASDYSAFVVGSDQLWLPSNISAGYYTLGFLPDGAPVRRVAYATSFGVSSLPARQAQMARAFLPTFGSIMVREASGQQLVRSLIGRDVPIVADPTLLFTADAWGRQVSLHQAGRGVHPDVARATDSGRYILCYFLGASQAHRAWARQLADQTGCRIVQLPHLDEYVKSDAGFADLPIYDADPLDFVHLIRHAHYVLTDSFHCTVFSALHRKTFFTFRRYADDGPVSTNSRLYSLLDTLGVPERMLTARESVADCLAMTIDHDDVQARIEALRQRSLGLLADALGLPLKAGTAADAAPSAPSTRP